MSISTLTHTTSTHPQHLHKGLGLALMSPLQNRRFLLPGILTDRIIVKLYHRLAAHKPCLHSPRMKTEYYFLSSMPVVVALLWVNYYVSLPPTGRQWNCRLDITIRLHYLPCNLETLYMKVTLTAM